MKLSEFYNEMRQFPLEEEQDVDVKVVIISNDETLNVLEVDFEPAPEVDPEDPNPAPEPATLYIKVDA